MGNSSSNSSGPAPSAAASPAGKCPVDHGGRAAGGTPAPPGHPATGAKGADACPVMHKDADVGAAAAALRAAASASASAPASSPTSAPPPACPVHVKDRGPVYNVYGEVLDPRNNMPSNPNQLPAPGQSAPLSTERVRSTIPKGGTSETWLYPSEQMFFNALVRKGKADGVREADMPAVIAIHNAMNETTWAQLLTWEASHGDEHDAEGPKLRRFLGRPFDLSPKARLRAALGGGYPFDRHDWFVVRGDKEVRYVIDYYYTDAGQARAPNGRPIWVDVRPALDSVSAVVDRVLRFPGRTLEAVKRGWFKADGVSPADVTKEAVKAADEAGGASGAYARTMAEIDTQCAPFLTAMRDAAEGKARDQAHVALRYCMGRVLCPTEATAFMKAVETATPESTAEETAFDAMSTCVVTRMQAVVDRARAASQKALPAHGAGVAEAPARVADAAASSGR
jgi:cytochrome c heme-lyase